MIEKKSYGEVSVLHVKGSMDHTEMVDIRNVISDLIREGHSQVIISVKDVKYINYMSIGVLVERLKRLRNCGGDLKLVGVNGYLKKIFQLIGVAEIFDSFESIEEARKSFLERHARKRIAV